MEFTFTSTPSSALHGTPSITPVDASEQPATAALSDVLNYERVSLKRARGVGNTTQWRKRLITQIEDRIKDRRTSIHNARRSGLQFGNSIQDTSPTTVSLQPATKEPIPDAPIAPFIIEEEEKV
jgi:hypothetical protein